MNQKKSETGDLLRDTLDMLILKTNNRRAKFYRLTAAGRKQLVEETAHWKRMSSAIGRILEPA
jgi:DNA-binding PadR family transcriptional regulator